MNLFISRHGYAVNVGENGVRNDYERFLTKVGRKNIELMAQGLLKFNIQINAILSSPYKRTIETASIYRDIHQAEALEVEENLQSGARFEDYWNAILEKELLNKYPSGNVLMVGHAPDVGKVCDVLLGTRGLDFMPGNLACIQIHEGQSTGRLLGFWAPEFFNI